MRLNGIIAATLVAGIGLTGCPGNGERAHEVSAEDGLRCDLPGVGDRVHIEIRYATDGAPSALPDECTVAPGTRITWRGPDGRGTPFALQFSEGSPAGRGEPRELRSRESADRQKIVLVAGDAEGRYKYGIEANGIVVDPAIIIDR